MNSERSATARAPPVLLFWLAVESSLSLSHTISNNPKQNIISRRTLLSYISKTLFHDKHWYFVPWCFWGNPYAYRTLSWMYRPRIFHCYFWHRIARREGPRRAATPVSSEYIEQRQKTLTPVAESATNEAGSSGSRRVGCEDLYCTLYL